MKRPEVGAGPSAAEVVQAEMPKLLSKCPHFADLVVNPVWDDGERKGSRAVMLFIDDGAFRLLFKVESPNLKFSVVARTWDDVFAAAELCVKSGQVVWETDQRPQSTPKRGKK